MKKLYSLLLLALALCAFDAKANTDVWEKYCSSPEGAMILGFQGNGADGVSVMTYSKVFIKNVNDESWTFASKASLEENRPCWFVGAEYMYSVFDKYLTRTNIATKATDFVEFPDGVRSDVAKRMAAIGSKCAIWCSGESNDVRYVYDYSSNTWSDAQQLDYHYSDVKVCFGGVLWRNTYGEFGYDHRKSTDLGETWSDRFTNESSVIFVDHLGRQFSFYNNVISRIDDGGTKLEEFPSLLGLTPKRIETYDDSKLIVQYKNEILIIDIASKMPIDTLSIDENIDGYIVDIALAGSKLYLASAVNVYEFTDLASEPVLCNNGLNSAMGLFLTPYKGQLLMRSVFGLFGIDQFGSVKLSDAFSSLDNPSGRDMIVCSDNTIYIIDKRIGALYFSKNDGQDWQEVIIPQGDVPDYITEIQPIGVIIATQNSNRVYAAQTGATNVSLIATIEYPEMLEFNFIKMIGSTIIGLTDQMVFKSVDMGQTWTGTPCSLFNSVSDVFSMGDETLWVASAGEFYETTDAGDTWLKISDEYNFLYPLQLPDNSILFAHATTLEMYRLYPDKSIMKVANPAPDLYVSSLCLHEGNIYATTIGGDIFRMPYSVLPAEEPSAWEQVAAFPLPAADFVTIVLGNASAIDVKIDVFNSLGEKQAVSYSMNGNEAKLNVSNLPQGVYSARVTNKKTVTSAKFVIAR